MQTTVEIIWDRDHGPAHEGYYARLRQPDGSEEDVILNDAETADEARRTVAVCWPDAQIIRCDDPPEIRLTDGRNETFPLRDVERDSEGPVRGRDSRGGGYARCTAPACAHEHAPEDAIVWHDLEHTEELWEERVYA